MRSLHPASLRRPLLLMALITTAAATLHAASSNDPAPRSEAGPHSSSTLQKKEIIAYVFPRDRAIIPSEIAARKLTRINYAFANIKDGEIVEGSSHDTENFTLLYDLKRDTPSLKILVSVGGWTWSGGFSDAALTKRSRTRFIDSAVRFIDHHKLDGLDIDWEYPGLPGAGNTNRPEDKHNFTLLLSELRTRFNREHTRLHHPLLLTIATGASAHYLEHTEMAEVSRYVDTVNLMTYDFYTGGPSTGHDAPLFHNPSDPKQVSAHNSVTLFLEAGVPASKLVLGLPFYGRSWSDVPATNDGLFQPGKPATGFHFSYPELPNLLAAGFIRHWDATAGVPFLYNPQSKIFVTYEDPESIANKCTYVRTRNLRGVMFWEYFNDSTGILLDAVHAGLSPTTFSQTTEEAPAQDSGGK